MNFQSLAGELRGSGLGVYAVELPGHDLAGEREPFAPLAEVVEQVVGEIIERGLSRVWLWGHSSGAVFALEAAKRLEQRGVDVARVFVGAQLLGEAGERRAAIGQLTGCGNAGIAAGLSADGGYTELGELDEQRAEHLGAAYGMIACLRRAISRTRWTARRR